MDKKNNISNYPNIKFLVADETQILCFRGNTQVYIRIKTTFFCHVCNLSFFYVTSRAVKRRPDMYAHQLRAGCPPPYRTLVVKRGNEITVTVNVPRTQRTRVPDVCVTVTISRATHISTHLTAVTHKIISSVHYLVPTGKHALELCHGDSCP